MENKLNEKLDKMQTSNEANYANIKAMQTTNESNLDIKIKEI
jgi:hypothetical protein